MMKILDWLKAKKLSLNIAMINYIDIFLFCSTIYIIIKLDIILVLGRLRLQSFSEFESISISCGSTVYTYICHVTKKMSKYIGQELEENLTHFSLSSNPFSSSVENYFTSGQSTNIKDAERIPDCWAFSRRE